MLERLVWIFCFALLFMLCWVVAYCICRLLVKGLDCMNVIVLGCCFLGYSFEFSLIVALWLIVVVDYFDWGC